MNITEKIALVLGFIALGFLIVFTKPQPQTFPSQLGSVVRSSEYRATTTSALGVGQTLIQTGDSVLGSIVVASSSAGTFKIWNATSTTDTASTTVTSFPTSATVGTYTYDIVMPRGIIVELGTGSNGSYTVTYR